MANFDQFVSITGGTASVIQGFNQYSLGAVGGFAVDYLFSMIPVPEENMWARLIVQLAQAGVDGLLLRNMLAYIHGSEPSSNYRDPTGGYMLAIGFIHGQPIFNRNGKQLVGEVMGWITDKVETFIPNLQAAAATDQEHAE